MEKLIQTISSVITSLLIYMLAAYLYLSYKGFVFQNGTFEFVQSANAGLLNPAEQASEQSPQTKVLSRDVSLNFPQMTIAGSDNAPLTIYEFSSLGCTHCADFHLNGLPKLEKNYLNKGKVRVVFIHFPLDRRAMQAAMLAECVTPDKKPDFLNLVFAKQREWVLSVDPEKYLINYAFINGLNAQDAEKCLKNDELAKEIIFSRQEAIDKLKIEGTPSFLISGKDKNEIMFGIANINNFKAYLDKRIEEIE